MTAKKTTTFASAYLDRRCSSSDEFVRLRDDLAKDGYHFQGLYSADPKVYHEFIQNDLAGGLAAGTSSAVRHNFSNLVEERTWYFREYHGQKVIRTTAFVEGRRDDGLVAFFVAEVSPKHLDSLVAENTNKTLRELIDKVP